MDVFTGIREDKNEKLLLELVRAGKLDGRSKEGMDALILAVDCEFSADTIDQLIKMGMDANTRDNAGRTPLHYAVDLENTDIIKVLVGHGADPDVKDEAGLSAREEADEEVLELLRKIE